MTSPEARRGGPFLKAAFLCEQVIEGKDNVNSYIRVVDSVTLNAEVRAGPPTAAQSSESPREEGAPGAPELPDSLPPFQWSTVMVLMFVGGDARGRQTLRLIMETPDGLRGPVGGPVDIRFDGRPNALVNVHFRLTIEVKAEGLHWIHVVLDEREMTRVPLDVMYQRR